MLWKLIWQMNGLVCSPLRDHHNAADFLHLWIIWRTSAVQIACNLKTSRWRNQ